MKKNKTYHIAMLSFVFSAIVFFILTTTFLIVGTAVSILVNYGIITTDNPDKSIFIPPVIIFVISSIIVGTIITVVVGKITLKPFNAMINGINSLADGNYETRLKLGNYKMGIELNNSFNALATELENTEILRSDFVNNFSHEFKTPITSILGFTKLLKKGSLTEEQRQEYLEIIEEEASRLVVMSKNVLDMTKFENQNILTNISHYNLSEQIRTCVILLEKKWEEKNISISVDFDEHYIDANEDMMKEVFINLLDNAAKFTPKNGEIEIKIQKSEEYTDITIKNTGVEISEEDMPRIFNKFYQCDKSHSSKGSGLGLSIAKRIVELHSGKIFVKSGNSSTAFTVSIPSN